MLTKPPRIEAANVQRRARHPTSGSIGAYTDQNVPATPARPPARTHVIRRTWAVRIPEARARSKFEAIARIPFPTRVRVKRRWRATTAEAVAAGTQRWRVVRFAPGPKLTRVFARRSDFTLSMLDTFAKIERTYRITRPTPIDATRRWSGVAPRRKRGLKTSSSATSATAAEAANARTRASPRPLPQLFTATTPA